MGLCINEEAETLRLRTRPVTREVTAVTEEGAWARGSIRGLCAQLVAPVFRMGGERMGGKEEI
jgi:hypothetical protein